MPDEEVQEALEPFINEGWINDILHMVKSGKEATVYCCSGGARVKDALVAAKVYRPLEERGFRNDAMYRAGRVILDKRVARALATKTAKGREFQYATWMHDEWETLRALHRAGADVPRTIAFAEHAILMQFIGDEGGAAPSLQRVHLSEEEAPRLFAQLMRNVELWLRNDRIHGDLSPYNVLYHRGRLVVIDFPQAVDPRFNPHAFDLLLRDLQNVCRYFARFGVQADPFRLADSLWRRFQNADL